MKYKVGDKVRIKSKEWYDKNKDESLHVDITKDIHFIYPMSIYCGKVATITRVEMADDSQTSYRIDLDDGDFHWVDGMFEDPCLDDAEETNISDKPSASEQLIKDIAAVINHHNLGVSVSENEGKLIIEPIKVDNDLEKGTYVMVTNDTDNDPWTLRQYLGNGYCDVFKTGGFNLPAEQFKYIIEFEKFDPSNIEESLKYNIVK